MSRPASEAADFKAMLFRLPPHLEEFLREEAAASGRPLNTQLIWILEHFYAHPVKLKAPRPRRETATASV